MGVEIVDGIALSQLGVCEMRYVSRRDHSSQNADRSIIDSLFALPYWLSTSSTCPAIRQTTQS